MAEELFFFAAGSEWIAVSQNWQRQAESATSFPHVGQGFIEHQK
jgi:hypothetical protein